MLVTEEDKTPELVIRTLPHDGYHFVIESKERLTLHCICAMRDLRMLGYGQRFVVGFIDSDGIWHDMDKPGFEQTSATKTYTLDVKDSEKPFHRQSVIRPLYVYHVINTVDSSG